MTIGLQELTDQQVIGCNLSAIRDAYRKDSNCQQKHVLVRPADLKSCLAGVFYQDARLGYGHLPIENIAGLVLFRIAEGQFFIDGNKRTALLSCNYFLANNGYSLHIHKDQMNDLIWGFGVDSQTGVKKYNQNDAVQYITDNITPRRAT